MAHTCNPSTQETEAGNLQKLRSAYTMYRDPVSKKTEGLGCSSVVQCLPNWDQSPVLKKGNHMDTNFIES